MAHTFTKSNKELNRESDSLRRAQPYRRTKFRLSVIDAMTVE